MGIQEGEPHSGEVKGEWISPNHTDPSHRIYNVSPERREEAFRFRTSILQSFHELERENKPPFGEDGDPKRSQMSVAELADRLRGYPLLQSYVLETMTDSEWEEHLSRTEQEITHSKRFQKTKGFLKKVLPGIDKF